MAVKVKMMKARFAGGWLLSLLCLAVAPVLAQDVCPAIVRSALDAIGNNCAELTRNVACYGFDNVDSTFRAPRPADFFSRPADRAELTEMETIRTTALDVENQVYGAAVMNVQANVPNSFPGQAVLFLLLGDAEVRNDVLPDSALTPIDPVTVAAVATLDLLTAPARTADVVRTVAAGEALVIDGTNTSREYVRVVLEGGIAWAVAGGISGIPDDLPVVSGTPRTPMQAFYFSTGIGAPACNEAESLIAVQSPENIEVELTVNGVDIRVGSLITFKNQSNGTQTLTVHRGQVQTPTGPINAGQTGISGTTDEGNSTGWDIIRDNNEEEDELGDLIQEMFNEVSESNDWPTQPPPSQQPPPDETPQDGFERDDAGNIIHIVRAGETLFGIARLYNASMPAIVARNNLADPRAIFVGQRLLIPNAGSGFVGIPGLGESGEDDTGDEGADAGQGGISCAGFTHIAPLDAAVATEQSYSWTAVAGATRYKLNFFDYTGAYSTSFFVTAPGTSIIVNPGTFASGGALQWEVEALVGEQSVCNTGRTGFLNRAPDPNEPPGGYPEETPEAGLPGFNATYICTGYYGDEIEVVWTGAKSDVTITGEAYGYPFTYLSSVIPGGSYNIYYADADNLTVYMDLVTVSLGNVSC